MGVRITRRNGGTVSKAKHDQRIYVTGPHFGTTDDSVFSGTLNPDDPDATFSREDAERLIAKGKWPGALPQIEDA